MEKNTNKNLIITLFLISILIILTSAPVAYFGIGNIFFINQNLVNNEFDLLVFLLWSSLNLIAFLIFKVGLEFLKKNNK